MEAYSNSISDSLNKLKQFLSDLHGEVAILSHVDADGLCAATILKRFLEREGIRPHHLYPGKGENAYSPGTVARLRQVGPDALFVLDLGVMDRVLIPDVPTVFIDHHRPFGYPRDAVVISSYGKEPSPPATYLVYDLLSRLKSIKDLAWLSAVGTAGDIGIDAVFAHPDNAVEKLKKKDITESGVLINSAKRSSHYDIDTAIAVLNGASDISELVNPETSAVKTLQRYRAEVNREVRKCRHERPYFSWKAAVIPFKSRCDIQGLIAETWRRQLRNYLVIAANFGYIEDKVAYVVRTELDISVIDFMESVKPTGYDQHVVFGHDRAGGGVLDKHVWSSISEKMRLGNTK